MLTIPPLKMPWEVSGEEPHLGKKIMLTSTTHKFRQFLVGKLLLTMLSLDNVWGTQRLRSNQAAVGKGNSASEKQHAQIWKVFACKPGC